VWLHGGRDLRRIQSRVEHVTAAPGPRSLVRMHTRWGIVRLGAEPALEELAPEIPGTDEFVRHLEQLGVRTGSPSSRPATTDDERAAAVELFTDAAERGYAVGVQALKESGSGGPR
jgi:glutaconate CoA-transferase subunit B